MKNKWRKIILITIVFAIVSAAVSLAVWNPIVIQKTSDVNPPKGSIIIRGAEEVEGINYVNSFDVVVEIFAEDDTCAPEEIKYYITDVPINLETPIEDSLWKSYYDGVTETIPLTNFGDANTISVIFKDKYGNTSGIFNGNNSEYNIVFNANGGKNAPKTQKAKFGMPLNLTNDRPTFENKYFVGWSTIKGSSMADYDGVTIYKQGEKIAATAFGGTEKNITLYAVWADEVNQLPTLAERVKVGDYVNYPVEYKNVYTSSTGEYKATLTGWRVLSVEADGSINLVSAGVPLTYYHYSYSEESIKNLAINFLDIPFSISEDNTFRNSGFNPYMSLEEVFDNKYTAAYQADETVSFTSIHNDGTVVTCTGEKQAGDLKIRSITKEDLDKVYDSTGATVTDRGTKVTDEKYEKLLAVPVSDVLGNYARYWLASADDSTNLRGMGNNGSVHYGLAFECGVRPVVTLKANVRTTGTNSTGAWDIEIKDKNIKSTANAPILGAGMKAVYWTDNNATSEIIASNFTKDMYSYTLASDGIDAQKSKWANAKTEDGSYWVWIPRYAYKIMYYQDAAKTIESETKTNYGEINVIFLNDTSNTEYIDEKGRTKTLPEEYIVHPAFQSMTTEDDKKINPLGKWNVELPGIWVAKYEASREDLVDGEWVAYTEQSTTYGGGNVATSETTRMVSKPSRLSWKFIQQKNIYENSLKMYETLNSHQMKNSEWGAVAYLTQSAYGRNGNEIGMNQNYLGLHTDGSEIPGYTGAGPGGIADVQGTTYEYDVATFESQYAWHTEQGKKASSTGNVYGIYDLSGGAWEYMASYVNNGNAYLTSQGGTLTDETNMHTKQLYLASATDGTSDTSEANYELNSSVYGDAVYETSKSVNGGSWNSDYSYFPFAISMFFERGGRGYSGVSAGVFAFNYYYGGADYLLRFPPSLVCSVRHLRAFLGSTGGQWTRGDGSERFQILKKQAMRIITHSLFFICQTGTLFLGQVPLKKEPPFWPEQKALKYFTFCSLDLNKIVLYILIVANK